MAGIPASILSVGSHGQFADEQKKLPSLVNKLHKLRADGDLALPKVCEILIFSQLPSGK